MTVEELRNFINAIANKDQTGNSMTPEEYNVYLQRSTDDKLRIELGLRENADLNSKIHFDNNQISTDAMRPFMNSVPIVAAPPGEFAVPTDYWHHRKSIHLLNGKIKPITVLGDDEFDDIQDDAIKPPSLEYPYAKFEGTKFVVVPNTIPTITFRYLKKPTYPVWGYTIVNDEAVYNAATSVQLQWEDKYHIDIARIILAYLGINFRDEELLQYAMVTKAQGN